MFTIKRQAEAGEIRDAFHALEGLEAERSTKGKNQILIDRQDNRVLKTLLYNDQAGKPTILIVG